VETNPDQTVQSTPAPLWKIYVDFEPKT